MTEEQRRAVEKAHLVEQMVSGDGWQVVRGTLEESLRLSERRVLDGLEWDDYQRAIGFTAGLRYVLDLPESLRQSAGAVARRPS